MTQKKMITIVIPTLNEEPYIEKTIDSLSLLSGKEFSFDYEVIVVDGGSTDKTVEICNVLSQKNDKIRVIHNPDKIQSAGINRAVELANPSSTILVRADAHAIYSDGFLETVVEALVKNNAQSVVVPLISTANANDSKFAQATAFAQNLRVGNGGADHRVKECPSKWVDHGHHAAFDMKFFKELGGYDPTFSVNEDAELDHRIINSLGKIWQAGDAVVWYSPRGTWKGLAKQYFKYGFGRASTFIKHGTNLKLRQIVPIYLFLFLTFCMLIYPLYGQEYVLPVTIYLMACFSAVTVRAYKTNDIAIILRATAALVTMHMFWGAGFIAKVLVKLKNEIA